MSTSHNNANLDLFYTSLVQSYVDDPHFVERRWLVDEVQVHLDDPACRFLLVTAEPGAGKTALSAWLAHQHPAWLRYFIRRDSRTPLSSGDARSFLFAVGHQLAALRPGLFRSEQLDVVVRQRVGTVGASGRAVGIQVADLRVSPFYRTALKVEQDAHLVAGELTGLSVRTMVVEERFLDVNNLQYLALLDPATALLKDEPDAQLVLLVDALDELRYYPSGDNILTWLAACPELPANVRIVLTSRPEGILDRFVESQQSWLRRIVIEPASQQVQADLHQYVVNFTAEQSVQRVLAEAEVAVAEFRTRSVAKAEGNFLYLAALFRGIEQAIGQTDPEPLHRLLTGVDLPTGLDALYAFFVRQVRTAVVDVRVEVHGEWFLDTAYLPAWEGLYQPLMGTLAVTHETLDHMQLLRLSAVPTEVRWVIGATLRLAQFLEQQGSYVRLYHTTLPEFLTRDGTWQTYPDCYFDPREWHRKIVVSYLNHFAEEWERCDDYGLRHLIKHIAAADFAPQALAAVLDEILSEQFVEAVQERFGWLFALMEDLPLLAEVAPQRVADLCLEIIQGSQPNSLVFQHALRLLVSLRPIIGRIGRTRSPNHRVLDETVRILSESPPDRSEQLSTLFAQVKNARVKSIVALALGETGSQQVTGDLLAMLKTARRQGSWAAADALITLNDRTVIPALIQWYEQTESRADKERILYVLGWMHAEEARAVLPKALQASDAKVVGRAIDLFWLLPAAEGDSAILRHHLRRIVACKPDQMPTLGPWASEWVQKRLVRALHRAHDREALPLLEELQDALAKREGADTSVTRRQLQSAIQDAIHELSRWH